MSFAIKLIKGATSLIKGNTKELRYVPELLSSGQETRALLHFADSTANTTTTVLTPTKIAQYRVKPDITIPINPQTLHLDNPAFKLSWQDIKAKDSYTLGELGNVSLRLSKQYKSAMPNAEKEIKEIFEGFNVSVRPKGPNSVMSKLERMIVKGKKTVITDADARDIIQDAIGGRVHLPNLTAQDVKNTIDTFKVDGQLLTDTEKQAVMRLFRNEQLTQAELETAQKYAKPIKIALAEKHSEPAVKRFMLAGIKDALNRNLTTIDRLQELGISKELLHEVSTNPKIRPLRLTEINNYKGPDGIAYFSDNQIRQFERLQLATGEPIDIITCGESIDLAKYGIENLPKSAQDAIKKSGYTTGQINVKLSDGNYAEIQIRGSGPFGEYEHLKYDASQEKNTLSEIFQPYVQKVRSLSDEANKEYNRYISQTYDYYRDPELGIISSKPDLPPGFDPILSEESMKHLHDLNEIDQANKMQTFVPHIDDNDVGLKYIA